MAITVQRKRRLELWSSWTANGGKRVAVIAKASNVTVVSNIYGTDKLSFRVPLESSDSALLAKGNILRLDQSDQVFDEWKITGRDDDTAPGFASITAAPFRTTALIDGDYISRLDSDGVRNYKFESVGLTALDHIVQWVLPQIPSFVTVGVIDPSKASIPLDLAFSWDKPLAVLQRIADDLGLELDIRRVGSVGYAVDMVQQIGHDAATADLRPKKNILRLARSISAQGHATRVFPKGQALESVEATMAKAVWLVTAVSIAGSDTVVTLADPAGGDGPIAFNGQLADGRIFLRATSGTLYGLSVSSLLNQTVTIPAAIIPGDITAGDLIDFRTDAVGSYSNDLAWLDSPVDVAQWGIIAANVDASDVPGHRNLVRTSALRDWLQGNTLPASWVTRGAPTLARQTAAPYVLSGANSIRVTTSADGDGVETAPVPIFPSADNPHVSGFVTVWVPSGLARVELVFTTPTGTVVQPVAPAVASNGTVGQWEDLGVAGIDARAINATAVAIRAVQHGQTPIVFYVARAQIAEGAVQLPFVEGSGGTRLWQIANDQLRTNGAPTVAFEANLIDLANLDPQTWGDNATLVVGGSVLITHPRFPLQVLTRLVELNRSYDVPGDSKVTLSSKPDDLSGTYGRRKKKGRISPVYFDTPAAPTLSSVTAAIDTNGLPSIMLIATPDAKSLKVVISTAGVPADSTVESSGAIDGSQAIVSFASPAVVAGQTLYGKAFAYSKPNGGGLRSPPSPFAIPFKALKRSEPWADGGFALIADDPAGLRANASVSDSSGLASRRVNLTLAKSSAGSPDDLRSVPDGGGYRRTTDSYVDVSGRVVTIRRSGSDISGDFLGSRIDNLDGNGLAYGSQIAGAPSDLVALTNHSVFAEHWDGPNPLARWNIYESAGGCSIIPGGRSGGNMLRMRGQSWIALKAPIAFDPTKLYVMRIVAYDASDGGNTGGTGPSGFFVGVEGVAADGSTRVSVSGANTASNQHYIVRGNRPLPYNGTVWAPFTGFFRGLGTAIHEAPDAGSPSPLYPGVSYVRLMVAANYGGSPSAEVMVDSITLDVLDERASALTYGGWSGVGTIGSGVTQGDPAGGRVMLRGEQRGTCRHLQAVVATPPFQNVPVVEFYGWALGEPGNRWGAIGDGSESGAPAPGARQYPIAEARSLTGSGFVPDLRFRQKIGTTSPITDNWANAPTITDIGTGTDKTGATTGTLAPSGAPSSSGTYSIALSSTIGLQYDPTIGGAQSFSITAAVDVDPTGTGAWEEAGTYTFTKSGTSAGSTTYSTTINVNRAGLSPSSQFRVRVKGMADRSAGSSGTLSGVNATYQRTTGAADQYASMTPDAEDVVRYRMYESSLT